MSKFGDKLDIGPGPVEDDVVDMSHVLLDKRGKRLKTGPRIVRLGKLDDNSHGILLNSSKADVKRAKVSFKAGRKSGFYFIPLILLGLGRRGQGTSA
jgi:hypothetical protein